MDDGGHIWSELLIIFVLIIFNGICSMTEIAIVGARKTKLREMEKKGNKKAGYALRIAENPENLFQPSRSASPPSGFSPVCSPGLPSPCRWRTS